MFVVAICFTSSSSSGVGVHHPNSRGHGYITPAVCGVPNVSEAGVGFFVFWRKLRKVFSDVDGVTKKRTPPPLRKHGRGPRSPAKTAVQRPPRA